MVVQYKCPSCASDLAYDIEKDAMMCPHCKARVESVCKEIDGVTDAVVDLQAKTVTVTGNGSVPAIKEAIVKAGYEVTD